MFRRDALNLAIRLPTIAVGLYLGGLPGIVFARALTGGLSILINMHLVRSFIAIPIRTQLLANRRALASVAVMALAVWLLREAIGTTGSTGQMIATLATLAVAGAVVYGTTSWLLWRVEGRPDGPERQVMRIRHQLAGKLRGRA
jgi:hypothetical protein